MAAETARYWQHAAVPGVDLLRARFVTHRYSRHAHETYTLGLIEAGTEEFEYGGTLQRAGAGGVALLNPEVVHTGQAGSPDGWAYRVLYPAVDVVSGVAADLGWGPRPALLPGDGGVRRAQRRAAAHGPHRRRARRPARLLPLLTTALAGLLAAHACTVPHRTGPGPCPPVARRGGRDPRPARGAADRPAEPDDLAEAARDEPVRAAARVPRRDRAAAARVPEPAAGPPARRLLDRGMAPADVAVETGVPPIRRT